MKNYFNFLIDTGIVKSNQEQNNQRIRLTNTIAIIYFVFIVFIFSLLLFQYGFKVGAKLVLISSLIPLITILLNKRNNYVTARYWISIIIPIIIITVSLITKINNPKGSTVFYEFFDTRMLLLVSVVIPLIIFPRKPLRNIFLGLFPSAILLFFYDPIHNLFGVGYNDIFKDLTGGYYIAGLMFNASYVFAVIGILSLKNINEKLFENNAILINDLHNKNKIQEKILLRKQELLSQNRAASESLLKKQEEILYSKKQLQLASDLIRKQKDELEFKNIELSSKIEDRTRELKQANEELIIQNNGLLQFSNTVSHDLRAPVASLLGLVHLFEIEKDESLKKEMLSHIKSSSIALDTIISDLNKVVDIRNLLFQLKENISLSEEVEKIKMLLHVGMDEIGSTLETSFEIEKLYFIRSYIHSILYNLINNAIKYSNPKLKNTIRIKSWERDNIICLEVRDNGLGIDLVKFGNNLFKMHKRFHDHIDGKGMGLYLVKQQVEAMNGKITIKSKPGKGASFLMEFPIPEKIKLQEYYNSPRATISYDANLMATVLIWHKHPDTKEYMNVLNATKEMFANYKVINWLMDIRNLGFISDKNRTWFASKVLADIIKRGCKTIVIVKDENDGKDFSYWQNMIEIVNKMGVVFHMFFEYDLALEFLKKKELNLKNK